MVGLTESNRLIFVGGAPRSGTTLLQNMLDTHPDICGGPEFLHLPDIVGVRNRLHQSVAKGWIDDFCSADDVDRLTQNLIYDFLLPLADKYGCKYLSEKTPHNVLVFSELMTLFPEARFIHVIRDPRAIIASMLQVGLRGTKKGKKTQPFTRTVSAAIEHVRQCFRSGFDVAEREPERVITIAFKELVAGPEGETKKICDFLGVEWSSQMTRPGDKRHLGEKAICNEIWYDKKSYNRNPEKKEIDKWQKQLSTLQKIRITASFIDFEELAPFGYDLSDGLSSLEDGLSLATANLQRSSLRTRLKYPIRTARRALKRPLVEVS